jgi:GNAT superfamily N-acetyltransferase
MPVLVRDAVESDASPLCALWADLLLKPVGDDGSSPEDAAAGAVARIAADETCRILVAEIEGSVVGAAYLRIASLSPLQTERVIHVSHLQVDPDFVRNGVGRSLMEVAATWAEQCGIDALVTATAVNDREANRFMARYGMAQIAVLRGSSVAGLRARLPLDPSTAARVGGRSGRTVGQVVAVRRSQRRARGSDVVR